MKTVVDLEAHLGSKQMEILTVQENMRDLIVEWRYIPWFQSVRLVSCVTSWTHPSRSSNVGGMHTMCSPTAAVTRQAVGRVKHKSMQGMVMETQRAMDDDVVEFSVIFVCVHCDSVFGGSLNEDARLRPIRLRTIQLRPAGRNRSGRSRNWPKSNRWCLFCSFSFSFSFLFFLFLFYFYFFLFLPSSSSYSSFFFVLFLILSPKKRTLNPEP